MIELDYVRIDTDQRIVDSLRNGCIYKVISTGADYILVKNGQHRVMADSSICRPASRQDYLQQHDRIPEEDYIEDFE